MGCVGISGRNVIEKRAVSVETTLFSKIGAKKGMLYLRNGN
jgi:hypothetical protein